MASGIAGIVATLIIAGCQHFNIPILFYLSLITQSQDPTVDTGFLITVITTLFTNYTPPSVRDVARRLNNGVVAFATHEPTSPLNATQVGDKVVVPVPQEAPKA